LALGKPWVCPFRGLSRRCIPAPPEWLWSMLVAFTGTSRSRQWDVLNVSLTPMNSVADCSPTDRPSWPSTVTGRDLQGTVVTSTLHRSEKSPPSCPLSHLQHATQSTRWTHTGEPVSIVPLLRFTGCPLHRFIIVCPLPQHTGCCFGQRTATCATLVPASRFPTALLAFSTRCAADLLHSANGLEVRLLSGFPIPHEQARSGYDLHPTSVTTPRRIPLFVAVPHHCGLSLLGVMHDRAGTPKCTSPLSRTRTAVDRQSDTTSTHRQSSDPPQGRIPTLSSRTSDARTYG